MPKKRLVFKLRMSLRRQDSFSHCQ